MSRLRLRATPVGGALLVHPKGQLDERAAGFAEGLSDDPQHTLVVVDLPAGVLADEWAAVARLLSPSRYGSLRIVFGRDRGEAVRRAAGLISERLGREVVAADGTLVPTVTGGLFTPGDDAGWLRFRPGHPTEPDSRRFPRPHWERSLPGRPRAVSDRTTAQPVPSGVWLRHTDRTLVPGEHRGRIEAAPTDPHRLLVVLGSPDTPPLPVDDVARYWDSVLPDARSAVRFHLYGTLDTPESLSPGQCLADALDHEVVLYADLPSGTPSGTDDGTMSYVPVGTAVLLRPPASGSGVPEPREPAAGGELVAPGTRAGVAGGAEITAAAAPAAVRPLVPQQAPPRVQMESGTAQRPAGAVREIPAPVGTGPAPEAEGSLPDAGEGPAAGEEAVASGDPAVGGDLVPRATPASGRSPVPGENPASGKTPVPGENPASGESPVPGENHVPGADTVTGERPEKTTVVPRAGAPAGNAMPVPAPIGTAKPGTTPDPVPGPVPDSTPEPAPDPVPDPLTTAQAPPAGPPVPAPAPPLPGPDLAPADPGRTASAPGSPDPSGPDLLAAPGLAPGTGPEEAPDPAPEPAPAPRPVRPAAPRFRLESAAPVPELGPDPEPHPDPEVPAAPDARERARPAGSPAAASGASDQVRVQPVPGQGACAIPPERGVARERDWLRRMFSEQYNATAGAVSRVMSETPGLRGDSRAEADQALTELVAVRLYLSGDSRGADSAVRTAAAGPHVPLARCVTAGLRRLPSYRGPTLLRTRLTDAERAWYHEGRLVTEWAFCHARTSLHTGPRGAGATDILIWSMTSRRTAQLDPAVPDRVLFLPGTVFKVLRTDGHTVLMREVSSSEISADGRVEGQQARLDEIAVKGLGNILDALEKSGTDAAAECADPPGLVITPDTGRSGREEGATS
ncbi:hypothetical protein ACIBCP_35220 [Streptomyces sp. NPDC051287]|uniref:hypothetical protein n=1 Tax=Streptomyces sp. NPDC051287 TaxID=3365648 RepID=UPI0037A6F7F6